MLNLTPEMPFRAAARVYCEMRVGYGSASVQAARLISRNTEKMHARFSISLGLFFADTPLTEIHLGHLRAYQLARVHGLEPFIRRRRPHEEPAPCACKPAQINQELCFLRAILRRAGAWTQEMDAYYEELREDEPEVARALSPEEQLRWLEIARSRPRWNLVYWYSLLAFDSAMSTNELRGLRIGDIDLVHRVVTVPWAVSKNRFRHRSIAIESAETLWAAEHLLARARGLGSRSPLEYVFPIRRARGQYDPTQAMTGSGLKKLWEEVRVASDLRWFRPYDTRHTAITRLAEQGVPMEIIKARAGHVSALMSQHYTHISVSAQRLWLQHSQSPYLRRPPQRAEYGAGALARMA